MFLYWFFKMIKYFIFAWSPTQFSVQMPVWIRYIQITGLVVNSEVGCQPSPLLPASCQKFWMIVTHKAALNCLYTNTFFQLTWARKIRRLIRMGCNSWNYIISTKKLFKIKDRVNVCEQQSICMYFVCRMYLEFMVLIAVNFRRLIGL